MRPIASAALLLLAACREAPAPGEASRGADPAANREFAVFAQRQLVIEAPGAPVPAPVTVGSRASRETLAADDPEIVAIGPDGSLLGLRPGATVVRGVGTGSALAVRVVEAPGAASSRATGRAQAGVQP
jgi:hypothetical protein